MVELQDLVLSFINSMFEFTVSVILAILIPLVGFSIFSFLIVFSWDYIIVG